MSVNAKKETEKEEIICINCPKGCRVEVEAENGEIIDMTGYECPLGKDYAAEEYKNPIRVLPTTVRVRGGEHPLVPVKSEKPISKGRLGQAMNELAEVEVKAPICVGDVVKEDIAGTGVDMVATRSVKKKANNRKTGKAV